MSFMILRIYNQIWIVVWKLAWKSGLDLGTTPSKLEMLGYNHMEAVLCIQLEAYNYTMALS